MVQYFSLINCAPLPSLDAILWLCFFLPLPNPFWALAAQVVFAHVSNNPMLTSFHFDKLGVTLPILHHPSCSPITDQTITFSTKLEFRIVYRSVLKDSREAWDVFGCLHGVVRTNGFTISHKPAKKSVHPCPDAMYTSKSPVSIYVMGGCTWTTLASGPARQSHLHKATCICSCN